MSVNQTRSDQESANYEGHQSNPESKLKADGTPDHRFKEHGGGSHGNQGGRESGGFEEDPQTGSSSLVTDGPQDEGEGTYKPSLHDGKKQDGTDDKRVSSEHGFGGEDGPDPTVEGVKGGESSYDNGRLTH